MGELQVFNNAEFGSVRSFMVNGKPFLLVRMWRRSLVIRIQRMPWDVM